MRFSVLLAKLLVHCVLACTGPVAVRVAVNPLEQTWMADRISSPVIIEPLRGFTRACQSPISKGFLFSGLLSVAPYCAPGGIRVVSMSPSNPPSSKGSLRQAAGAAAPVEGHP